MACYSHHFTVEGMDPFPLDMLRYDACFPEQGGNLPHLAYHLTTSEPYSVSLVHRGPDKTWAPTEGRWRSFGWQVAEALPVTADPAILSLQSQAVLHEANVVGWPRAFEGDVMSDARYLDRERPEHFVWVLYDNGTQLLPARTPIPFPFAGRNPLDEVEYAEAFLRVYGDGEDRGERDIGARWYVYEEGRLRRVQATEAIERLRSWKKGGPRT